jgi:hypothetical protein
LTVSLRRLFARLLRSHAGFIVGERFEARMFPAFVESARIFDRMRCELAAGVPELRAVELRLPGVDPEPVLQVRQLRW